MKRARFALRLLDTGGDGLVLEIRRGESRVLYVVRPTKDGLRDHDAARLGATIWHMLNGGKVNDR